MKFGIAGHEVCCRLAGFNAIRHQSDMIGFGMFSARWQTETIESVLAFRVALLAEFNTFLRAFKFVVHSNLPS